MTAAASQPRTDRAGSAAISQLAVDTIRCLAMDAVQQANSGHPGLPMEMPPVAYALYTRFLRHDPADPSWPDRDRFVLSAGHGSMLLYAMLHLCGYDLELDELMAFRQWGSRTPGHPEYGLTPGVETTTGPLGQGFANGVGMALAERFLRMRYGSEVVDHRAGLAINPGTSADAVDPAAGAVDQVLCMTVNPGWGGQRFIDASWSKLAQLPKRLPSTVSLQVDGASTHGPRRHA